MSQAISDKKIVLIAANKGGFLNKLANELVEKHSDRYDVIIQEAIDMTYFRYRELEGSEKSMVVLTDYTTVGTMNSYELNSKIKERSSDVPVLVCTYDRATEMNCREQDLSVLHLPKNKEDKALDMLLRKINGLGKSGGKKI